MVRTDENGEVTDWGDPESVDLDGSGTAEVPPKVRTHVHGPGTPCASEWFGAGMLGCTLTTTLLFVGLSALDLVSPAVVLVYGALWSVFSVWFGVSKS